LRVAWRCFDAWSLRSACRFTRLSNHQSWRGTKTQESAGCTMPSRGDGLTNVPSDLALARRDRSLGSSVEVIVIIHSCRPLAPYTRVYTQSRDTRDRVLGGSPWRSCVGVISDRGDVSIAWITRSRMARRYGSRNVGDLPRCVVDSRCSGVRQQSSMDFVNLSSLSFEFPDPSRSLPKSICPLWVRFSLPLSIPAVLP